MRTALAALLLFVVAFGAVATVSYLAGLYRIEFVDRPAGSAGTDSEPVADAPADAGGSLAAVDMRKTIQAVPAPAPPILAEAHGTETSFPEASVPEARVAETGVSETGGEPAADALDAASTKDEASAPTVDPVEVATAAPRIVGGPGITPGPVSSVPLEREAVPPAPPPPPRWKVFPHVTIARADILDTGAHFFRLADVDIVPANRRCRQADGEFDCAFLALQALRQRVRSLGVECLAAPGSGEPGGPEPALAHCRIGKTDLSLWLVEQGWAEPSKAAPDAYERAEAKARCEQRGIWAEDAPPADCR